MLGATKITPTLNINLIYAYNYHNLGIIIDIIYNKMTIQNIY